MARPQVPRWLGRDAERVSHPPARQAPPPRSAAIRREVCSALHIFSAPYLATGATPRVRAQTPCRGTFRALLARTTSFGFLN